MREVQYDPDGYGIGYGELIESMEVDVLVEAEQDDYQGDSFLLVRKGEQYGFMTYGWGSCSGCDAAQAVSSKAEATELRDDLYKGIRWFPYLTAALRWLATADHELDWYGHEPTFKQFLTEVDEFVATQSPSDAEVAAAQESIRTAAAEKEEW